MIQQQTLLKISDNSGAKKAKCIKILGKKKIGEIGDIVVVSIKSVRNKKNLKVKKGEVYKGIILTTKKQTTIKDGSKISFNSNSICLLNKQGKPIGNRIIGPLPKILKNKLTNKLFNLTINLI